MQTSREHVALAGTQVPLLREEQIQPGVLLTGVAMSHVWEVVRVERTHVFIQKMPVTAVPCAPDAHVFVAFGRGQVCSACQMRKQAMSEFLPKREDKARVHVITPSNTVMTPQPYTVYGHLLANGTVQAVHLSNGAWDRALPVIPTLSIIWTIPESLRSMVSGRFAETDTSQIEF